MTDKIKPYHAASVWASGNLLYVELPNADGRLSEDDSQIVAELLRLGCNKAAERLTQLALTSKSHQLKLPLNVYGLTQLLNTLKARTEQSSIGEVGDITQFQADKKIQEMKRLAAGFKGPIKKPTPKIEVSPEVALALREVIRKFINI